MSLAEFQKYWKENHGPLVASHGQHLNILRYVQVHSIEEDDARKAQRAADPRGPMEPQYDGVAELWWNNRAEAVAAGTSPEGQAAGAELLEDEKKFIDLPNSPGYYCYEYPQVNPTPETIVATEMSSLIKLHYPLRHLKSLHWKRPSSTGAPTTGRSSAATAPATSSATSRSTALKTSWRNSSAPRGGRLSSPTPVTPSFGSIGPPATPA